MSKITYHIPTEQFGFVEVERENVALEEAISYDEIKASVMPKTAPQSEIVSGVGLDDKEWRVVLDGYRTVGTMPSEVHERMSKHQQWLIHQLDLSDARIKNKNG